VLLLVKRLALANRAAQCFHDMDVRLLVVAKLPVPRRDVRPALHDVFFVGKMVVREINQVVKGGNQPPPA
jgi:hypothetical protein